MDLLEPADPGWADLRGRPSGEALRVETANRFTSFGAACFLICAIRAMADADLEAGFTPGRIERQRERRGERAAAQREHRQPTGSDPQPA